MMNRVRRSYPLRPLFRYVYHLRMLDLYEKVCSIEADLTQVEYHKKYNENTGVPYYLTDFDVILLFGLTELKAQIAYMEDVGHLIHPSVNHT